MIILIEKSYSKDVFFRKGVASAKSAIRKKNITKAIMEDEKAKADLSNFLRNSGEVKNINLKEMFGKGLYD